MPAGWQRPIDNTHMSGPARKRRELFPSRSEAMWRYAARPPLNALRSECLAAYVEYGFHDLEDGTVRLACRAESEARTFEAAGLMTADRASVIATPVTVGLGGADAAAGVSLGDVALGFGDGAGDLGQQTFAIDRGDQNGGFKWASWYI